MELVGRPDNGNRGCHDNCTRILDTAAGAEKGCLSLLYLERELCLSARQIEHPLLCEGFQRYLVSVAELCSKGAKVDSDVLRYTSTHACMHSRAFSRYVLHIVSWWQLHGNRSDWHVRMHL